MVERCPLRHGIAGSFLFDEPALRLIHLSVNEVLRERHAVSCLKTRITDSKQLQLIPDVVIGNLDSARTCLKQILFNTPAQPLSSQIGCRISASDLYSQFCFTDYAAVNWLLFLPAFVIAVVAKSATNGDWSACFLESLSEFGAFLRCFLQSQRTVSVWLEVFFTAKSTDVPYPPAEALDSFATWAEKALQQNPLMPLHAELIQEMRDFGNELREVISVWSETLRDTPQTVWDEMTAFVSNSRYFWTSHSTEISYQRPTAPLQASLMRDPVALLSRTSDSGDLKATLSIWANT